MARVGLGLLAVVVISVSVSGLVAPASAGIVNLPGSDPGVPNSPISGSPISGSLISGFPVFGSPRDATTAVGVSSARLSSQEVLSYRFMLVSKAGAGAAVFGDANPLGPRPMTHLGQLAAFGSPAGAGTDSQAGAAHPQVPEPATWATMLVGFLGLGFLAYRRDRRVRGWDFRLS